MKRLALLLAAMGIISGVTMAEEPVLKVTGINQELEIENTSGGKDISDDGITFVTGVGLSYGDWTFGIQGGKFLEADTVDGIESTDGRLQLDAWKKINENLKLGTRYRGYSAQDRYYLRYSYKKDMFWSNADFWYKSVNGNGNDTFDVEAWPLGVTYGDFGMAWYVRGTEYIGNLNEAEQKSSWEHQARFYWNFFKGEKLSLATEYRITLDYSDKYEKQTPDTASEYKKFEKNRLYLQVSYDVTEKFNVYGYYGYQIGRKEFKNSGKDDNSGNYYSDLGIGWNYTF